MRTLLHRAGRRRPLLALLLAASLAPVVAPAATVTWYRMYAYSDSGGVWNTIPGSGNWYIWMTHDPVSEPNPTFLNGANPTISIPLAPGTNHFTMYRDTYASVDAGNTFYFDIDGALVTLSVTQNPAPWGSPAGFDPLLMPSRPSVTVGGTTVWISDYRWLAGTVYGRDLIGSTGFAPDGFLDLIGEVTFEVVPEPAAAALALLAAAAALSRRRPQRRRRGT